MACLIQRHQQHHTRAAFVWITLSHHSILCAILVHPTSNHFIALNLVLCFNSSFISRSIYVFRILCYSRKNNQKICDVFYFESSQEEEVKDQSQSQSQSQPEGLICYDLVF
jgi:hypothetical protein